MVLVDATERNPSKSEYNIFKREHFNVLQKIQVAEIVLLCAGLLT